MTEPRTRILRCSRCMPCSSRTIPTMLNSWCTNCAKAGFALTWHRVDADRTTWQSWTGSSQGSLNSCIEKTEVSLRRKAFGVVSSHVDSWARGRPGDV